MRFKATIGCFLLMGLAITSCQKNDNTSVIPSISFQSFTAGGSSANPTATLQINFTDGDGDIGYPAQDTSAAANNLWIEYLYCDTGGTNKFIGFPNPQDTGVVYFFYHVPYITPAGKDKSLKGIIQIAPLSDWFINPYVKLDSLKVEFRIWLFDRAGHKSNVITTPVILPYLTYGN